MVKRRKYVLLLIRDHNPFFIRVKLLQENILSVGRKTTLLFGSKIFLSMSHLAYGKTCFLDITLVMSCYVAFYDPSLWSCPSQTTNRKCEQMFLLQDIVQKKRMHLKWWSKFIPHSSYTWVKSNKTIFLLRALFKKIYLLLNLV